MRRKQTGTALAALFLVSGKIGISGLMIMGVCGGAVIPPLMGVLTDAMGTQAGSLIVITACALYLAFLAFRKRA